MDMNMILSVNQLSFANLMQSQEAARSLLAALAFLVWDVLITIDDEAVHVWQTRFQPLKVLYLFTRYYSVVALVILNTKTLTCKQWTIIEGISAVLLEIVVETILILRIYAMYAANRRLLQIIIPAFVIQIVIMAVALGVSLPKVMTTPMCAETYFPIEIVAYSVASIVFEAFLFGLTLYKYYVARHEGWAGATLLMVLVRDGMWSFVLVFVANVANTLFFTIAPATLAALGFPWLLAIFGSVGPRLVLNVRREHTRQLPNTLEDLSFPTISYASVSSFEDDLMTEEDKMSLAPTEPSSRKTWRSLPSMGTWKIQLPGMRSSTL